MLMAGTEIVWDKNNEENQSREIEDTCLHIMKPCLHISVTNQNLGQLLK